MQRPEPDETRPLPGSPAERGWGPLVLAGLVLLLSLALTWGAWNGARRDDAAALAAQFDYRARDLATTTARRMAVYEQVLRGTRGFMRGRVDISRAEFAEYFQIQNLQEHFPGIEALGVATIISRGALAPHEAAVRRQGFTDYRVTPAPASDPGRAVYTAITHIEPFAGRNLRAFGYDMYSEPVRRAAMDAARDSGGAALSGKVVLVQEGRNAQPGFLMYVPVYRAGMPAATVEQRRAAIAGWVYAPFRMADLMRGVGGTHAADLQVAVYDGARPDPEALLFRSQDATSWRRPLFQQTLPLIISGRRWTVEIASSPAFEARRDTRRPRTIAITGAGLGFLLSLVVWLLASERRRALQLARAMTLELRQTWKRNEAERRRMDGILRSSQKLEAVGKLTGGVVHDFNNILHIISANVQLMQNAGNNPAKSPEKRLRNILDAVERGSKLSAQLLAFARRQPLHPSVVNVHDLVKRMDSLLQRAAGESVTIELARSDAADAAASTDAALWNTLVDPNQLENVLLNLVINARDAMAGSGKVSIALSNLDAAHTAALADPEIGAGEYVLIAVSDTGEGMPPEVAERAFEPFFTTKPEGKGTGLGLSMAHGFVKQSGGHIRIDSVPGEGTTISIYLPRHIP